MSEPIADHLVTVTVADHGTDVSFTCGGDESSPCHQYPNCGCEAWNDDHEHPFVSNAECWLQGWFDNDAVEYDGDDVDYEGKPTTTHSGLITTGFNGDYIEWGWSK